MKRRLRLRLVALGVAGFYALIYAAAWFGLRGERLALLITDGKGLLPIGGINLDARGRLEVARVDWPPVGCLDALLGLAGDFPVRNGRATRGA